MTPRPTHRTLALLLSVCVAFAAGATTETPEAAATAGAPAAERVMIETRLGTMTIELFPDVAPRTVAQFRRLVGEGWYDGRPFYRVVAGHVIQAGDGGENDQPTVTRELGDRPHVVGAVGLARDDDPDSGSTELYVCLAPRPHLDGRYAIFGQVVDGLDVLAAIGAVPVAEKWLGEAEPRVAFHEPLEPVVIERAWIVPAGEAGGVDAAVADPSAASAPPR